MQWNKGKQRILRGECNNEENNFGMGNRYGCRYVGTVWMWEERNRTGRRNIQTWQIKSPEKPLWENWRHAV